MMGRCRNIIATDFSLLAVISALNSCAQLPPLTPHTRFPVAAVSKKVNCEIKKAFLYNDYKKPRWFDPDKWAFSTEITMKADNEFNSEFGYSHKYSHSPARLLDLGLGGDFNQTGHRDTVLSYSAKMSDLRSLDCSKPIIVSSLGLHPLTGDLGVAKWRDAVLGDFDDFVSVDKLSYANEFTLKIDGNANPELTLTHATDTFKGSVSQSNDDTISLAFTRIDVPPPVKPLPVYIVSELNPSAGAPNHHKRKLLIAPSAKIQPNAPAPKPGLDNYTKQQLEQIQNQGVILRSLPDCRSRGLC